MGKQTLGTPSLHGSLRDLEPRSGFSRCQQPVFRRHATGAALLLSCAGCCRWQVVIRNGRFHPHVTPHAHGYFNRSSPFSLVDAVCCYDTWLKEFCREELGKQAKHHLRSHSCIEEAYQSLDIARRVYPVLHVSPMLGNDEIRHWLYYTVKCHKFVAEYHFSPVGLSCLARM